jgi:hypothetical protein
VHSEFEHFFLKLETHRHTNITFKVNFIKSEDSYVYPIILVIYSAKYQIQEENQFYNLKTI